MNVAASLIALAALRFAARPADDNHPYGHTKAEFFAAVIEGVLIVVAALAIFREALAAFLAPVPLGRCRLVSRSTGRRPWRIWDGRGGCCGRAWSWTSSRPGSGRAASAGRCRDLGRDRRGGALVALTGVRALDPALAAATGVYVLWSGMATIGASVGGLMDAAPAELVLRRIRELVAANAAGAIEAHDLRTRQAGRVMFLEFHLVVPGTMTVADLHAICDRIEAALRAEMTQLMISIHVEPEDKAKQHGVRVL